MKSNARGGINGAAALVAAAITALCACSTPERPRETPAERPTSTRQASYGEVNPRLLRRFQPLHAEGFGVPASAPLVKLGQTLFHDPRLSVDSTIACSSCHDLSRHGVDGQATSTGYLGKHGARNAPTVLNAAGAFAQFWDGRAATVEDQAMGPVLNPDEMAMPDGNAVVARLTAVPEYVAMFRSAFPNEQTPLTFEGVGKAIGAYERRLVTRGRWDRYLEGDKEALTAAEREGLRTFLNVGCMVCHTGPLLGGAGFERAGAVEPWANQRDEGRMAVTRSPSDRMMFKVPTLRNVADTAPYFHDGSATTLEQAVAMMGRHQLGLELTSDEIASIVTWLRSLGGNLPSELAAPPAMPR